MARQYNLKRYKYHYKLMIMNNFSSDIFCHSFWTEQTTPDQLFSIVDKIFSCDYERVINYKGYFRIYRSEYKYKHRAGKSFFCRLLLLDDKSKAIKEYNKSFNEYLFNSEEIVEAIMIYLHNKLNDIHYVRKRNKSFMEQLNRQLLEQKKQTNNG